MPQKQKILVILSLGLGDLVFSLPVILALKRESPDAILTFLTHENHADLLTHVGDIDSVITYKSKSTVSLLRLVQKIRTQKFSKVFVLNPIFRGSLLAWLSGAPERIGYLHDYEHEQTLWGMEKILLTHAVIPKNEKRHEVDRYLDLLEYVGIKISPEDRSPRLEINSNVISQNLLPHRLPQKRILIINLGAGWENRRWPADRIVKLSRELIEKYGAQIYFSGGSSEVRLADKILTQINHQGINLCGKTTLTQLAAYLKQCHLFITSDTGSLHIAAALNVPTLALFGPGDLEKVRPRSPNVQVLYHAMPCSPCRFQYTKLCAQNLCMQEISIGETLAAALKILGLKETASAPQAKTYAGKKKILYLQSTSEIGGTDVTLLRTLEALDKTRYEPHVILPKEGPFSQSYRKLGCTLHVVPSMRKLTKRKGIGYLIQFIAGYLPASFKIFRILKENHIDLVHTNSIHNLYGFFAAKCTGIPHIWHIREIVVQSSWIKHIEIFLVKYFSARFIVMDNAISEMFLSPRRGYPKNISKLYDGVDLAKFNPAQSGERIRKDLGLSHETPLIGTVGRLDPWKGLDLLIEAATLVHRQYPEAHFLICGGEIDGHQGYESKLHAKISSYRLQNNIHVTGWKYFGADIPEVYGALDISVQCPIFPEPYGLANIEAMASGVPTVAVREGGPVEICEADKTGFLVSPNQPEAIADAVMTLLKNPARAREMGTLGRKRAEDLFDYQKCTRNLEAIYADVLVHLHD